MELSGDPSVSVYERLWLRPAITVIGIDGHPIKGSSNQIVAEAAARISMRIATGQDPERINAALHDHLARRVPFGFDFEFMPFEGTPAWRCEPEGPAFTATETALRAAFGVDPVYMGVGGTIPFVGPFAHAFGGIPALLLGPRTRQPHSWRRREPPPRRLAQAHRGRNPPPRPPLSARAALV